MKLSPALPPDPAAAFADVMARAKNLEARLAGAGLVGDNLGAQLDAARSDALYAELLFLFLGLPGAVLAALVTSVIGAAGGDRRRREQALLRIRGASPRRIVWLAGAEALLVGVLGSRHRPGRRGDRRPARVRRHAIRLHDGPGGRVGCDRRAGRAGPRRPDHRRARGDGTCAA